MILTELSEAIDRSAFDCGDAALNGYFRERAGQDRRRGMNQTRILLDNETVVGFYTLSPYTLALRELPPKLAKKFPANLLLPCYLLGRLAVDKTRQGQGFGKLLLGDALRAIALSAQKIGGYCAVVDAKNDRAQTFYAGYDFRPVADNPRRLFLPIAEIAPEFLSAM
jgi:GNAT superfamily N-acetyltransferase